MIPTINLLRRLRRFQDILESSSSKSLKSVHEETTSLLGKKTSTSHFNNIISTGSSGDSRSFTWIDPKEKSF